MTDTLLTRRIRRIRLELCEGNNTLSSSLAAFRPVLHLSTLTAKTIDDFIAFRASQGRNNTTIAKDVKLLLWLLRWCHDNGRYDGDLHLTYSAKLKGGNFEDKEIIYLTLDELHAIEDAPLHPLCCTPTLCTPPSFAVLVLGWVTYPPLK